MKHEFLKAEMKICPAGAYFYYFCDSRNIIEISRCLLFFSKILRTILNNSDTLFGCDCKREN